MPRQAPRPSHQQPAPKRSSPPWYPANLLKPRCAIVCSPRTALCRKRRHRRSLPLSASAGYNQFIANLQAWGRYTLVDSASQADLVLQFRNVVFTQVLDGTRSDPSATVYYEPEFRLTIADPQTLKPMWSYVLPVLTGTNRKTHQDLFAVSVENITSQLKVLAGQTLTPSESAALYPPAPKGSHLKLALGITGIAALLTIPSILFVVSKDHAEAQQHQFCVQNGLPC